MIVYAESSAVLAWLIGEPGSGVVRKLLLGAERTVTSALTAAACGRALSRGVREGRLSAPDHLAALRLLDVAERSWDIHAVTDRVLGRTRGEFPVEPVRTLDAIHLASAALLKERLGPVTILSLDDRVRANAKQLGFEVAPTQAVGE